MWKKLMATSALAAILAAPAYGADTTATMRDDMLNQAETETERQGMENRMAASEWLGREIYADSVDGTRLGRVEDVRMGADNQPEYVILEPDAALNLEGEAYAVPYDRFEEAQLSGTGVLVASIAADDLRGAPRQAQVDGQSSDEIAVTDADETDAAAGTGDSATTADSGQSGANIATGGQTSAAPETDAANQAAESDTSASATAETSTTTSGSGTTAGTSTSAGQGTASGSTGTDTSLTTSSVGNISAMTQVDLASIAQSDLNTAVVLSEDGEEIGRVDNVLTNDAGNPDAVVINAGTYLGGDEKQIAISTENAELRRNEQGEIYMVTSLSRADLQGAPDYTTQAYEEDAQSVLVDPSM